MSLSSIVEDVDLKAVAGVGPSQPIDSYRIPTQKQVFSGAISFLPSKSELLAVLLGVNAFLE